MRAGTKWAIRICLLLLSFESIIAIVDYFARWDWLEAAMVAHPYFAKIVQSPAFPLSCLCIAMLGVYGEKYLKQPSVMARYTNSRIIPNLKTTSIGLVFDTESQKTGWKEHEVDWYWLIEVRLANESDTPITVEDVEGRVTVGRNKLLRWIMPFTRKRIRPKHIRDVSKFTSSPHDGQTDYLPLPGLVGKITDVPLTKGIGHRGWLCFELRANQREMLDERPELDVWHHRCLLRKA